MLKTTIVSIALVSAMFYFAPAKAAEDGSITIGGVTMAPSDNAADKACANFKDLQTGNLAALAVTMQTGGTATKQVTTTFHEGNPKPYQTCVSGYKEVTE